MKFIKKFFKWLIIITAVTCVGLYVFGYGYLLRAVRIVYLSGHVTAYPEDYTKFDNHLVAKSTNPQPWPISKGYNTVSASAKLEQLHQQTESIAYLIIKNDSIWYESYFDGFNQNSKTNSFSMAKSMVSAMLGSAILEGQIKSLNDPVINYLPNLKGEYAKEVTVGDLSSMASGLDWNDDYYSPLSKMPQAYFDNDLRKMIMDQPIYQQPGQGYEYLSGNTQLLGMVLEKATGKTLAQNLHDKLWQPLGATNDALWQVDSEEHGMEKAYCCIASNARDFARVGKLYKDNGVWNGQQILPKDFVYKSTHPRFANSPEYGYGLWLLNYMDKDFFMLRGHLGQYVIVQPEDNVIIVRLGHTGLRERLKEGDTFSADIYYYISEAYKMMGDAAPN